LLTTSAKNVQSRGEESFLKDFEKIIDKIKFNVSRKEKD